MIRKSKKLSPEQAGVKINELTAEIDGIAKKIDELTQCEFNEANVKKLAHQYVYLANVALGISQTFKSIEFGG